MAAPSILTLRDLTKLELPDGPPDEPKYAAWVDAAVSAALEIVHSLAPAHLTEHWSKGKVHHGAQTYTSRSTSNPPPGAGDTCGFKWHVRQSRHDASAELSYEHFERGLLRDHSTNEQKYIESCTEARQIEVLKPGELESRSRAELLRKNLLLVLTFDLFPVQFGRRSVRPNSESEDAEWSLLT